MDQAQWHVCALSELLLCSGSAQWVDKFYLVDSSGAHRGYLLLCRFCIVNVCSKSFAVVWANIFTGCALDVECIEKRWSSLKEII